MRKVVTYEAESIEEVAKEFERKAKELSDGKISVSEAAKTWLEAADILRHLVIKKKPNYYDDR